MSDLPSVPSRSLTSVIWLLGFLLATAVPSESLSQEASRDSVPRWRLFGDLRVRGAMDRDRRNAPQRERVRIRFRLGGETDLGAGFTVGARIVTESDPDDPNSPYVDLGRNLSRARLAFDRLYARWTPRVSRPLDVWLGKFRHPFAMPSVYSELVWDADLQPEGIAAVFEPLPPLRLSAGGFLLLAQGDGDDVNFGVAQVAAGPELLPELHLDLALGAYFYGTPEEKGVRVLARRNRGNELVTLADGDTIAFASGFTIWQGHATLAFEGLPAPVSAAAEYFVNASAAPGLDDDGFAIGALLGRLGAPGGWRLEYRYQSVGRESVFSPVVQDDFLDAVGFRGHLAGLSLQYLSFARARAWMLWSARNEPREDSFQKRFRLDLDFTWRLP